MFPGRPGIPLKPSHNQKQNSCRLTMLRSVHFTPKVQGSFIDILYHVSRRWMMRRKEAWISPYLIY